MTLMIAGAALAFLATPAGAAAPVRVAFQGQSVTTDAPVIRSARGVLVPLRAATQALGGRVAWDGASRTAVVRHRRQRLEVDQPARTLRLNGTPMADAGAPQTTEGHLLVPLVALERLFAVEGRWSPRQRLLHFAAVPGGGSGGAEGDGPQVGGVRLRLSVDKVSYAVGAPVALSLTVTNPSRSPVTLQFSSGQKVDFEVRRAGKVVWQWAADRMFTQALTSLTLAPGERKVFTETWKQQDNNGQPAPAGSYQAVATLTTMEKPQPRSSQVAFRIGG